MTDLRYPVGPFVPEKSPGDAWRQARIAEIEELPAKLRAAVQGLSPEQLGTPYRPDGWTVLQVVNHVPDSHMNGYARFRWGLTEEQPPIKLYQEALWAELPDSRTVPPEVSLALLDALHHRWVILLRSLSPEAFQRTMMHPEHGVVDLDRLLGLYAWHGRHHTAHITSLRERMGW
ncbi:MAG TPA: bacillithiol transferase BstA [Thermoanaerobaculia bacterium]|nr:bacillithiol transferase BstA [Thermoanaerobaculia bacterium]